MSAIMGVLDFVPVILFMIAAVRLQRGLYETMSKGAFALFCAGTIMIITAGLCKALWKLLYGAGICDFQRLNQMFFPVQSFGFFFAGIAALAMVFARQESKTYAVGAVPAVFSGTFIFITVMVLGMGGLCTGLAVHAGRTGRKKAIVLFALAFVFMLMMGYLSSKDFSSGTMNWIAQGVNTAGQLIFMLGAFELTKENK